VPAKMDVKTLNSAGLQMIGTAVMGGDTVEYWIRYGLPWPGVAYVAINALRFVIKEVTRRFLIGLTKI